MATYTTRFNLTKPATTDTADIATINGNMDTIDGAIPAVVDNLTSTSTTSALSANQGKVLQDGKVDVSGETMTGALVAQNNTNYTTAQMRNITLSTADASGGGNGDIWIKYTA